MIATRRGNHTRAARRGFTLIEALATVVALSAIAATLGPIIYAAADAYAAATHQRQAAESAAHTIDRITRAVREIPAVEDAAYPAINTAAPTLLTWTGGNALVYDPNLQRLTLTLTGQPRAILAESVQAFQLRYLDALAQPIDTTQPDAVQRIRRIELRITIHNTEHRAAAVIRDGLGIE